MEVCVLAVYLIILPFFQRAQVACKDIITVQTPQPCVSTFQLAKRVIPPPLFYNFRQHLPSLHSAPSARRGTDGAAH
jgi:hypothetical protein